MSTRTTEPTQITQGERVAWTKTLDDYSAALYTLVYRFRGADGPGFNVTATADGTDFLAVVTAAVSAEAKPGVHHWQAWLTEIADSTNTFIVGDGQTNVKRGFASDTTAAVDLRSPAKIALDAVNAAISGQATANIQEYEIATPAGSRKIKRCSMADLLAARKEYAAIVSSENIRERMKKGGPFAQRIGIRVWDE
jgi:hypothetical protein